MKIKALLTICRDSNDTVRVRAQDQASRVQFVEFHLTLEDFAKLLTNQSHISCEGEVRGLDVVGKTKVTEPRSVTAPSNMSGRMALSEWLKSTYKEDGWFVDAHLNSQTSITHTHGKGDILNFRVYKFVDA